MNMPKIDLSSIPEKVRQYAVMALAAIVLVCASFAVGYWSHKPVSVTKTEIQTVEKIVEKQVMVKDTSVVNQTITKPDGTVEHTVTQNNVQTGTVEQSVTIAHTESKEQTVTAVPRPNYSISSHAIVPIHSLLEKPSYDIVAGYRALGELWVETMYLHDEGDKIGLGIRIGF